MSSHGSSWDLLVIWAGPPSNSSWKPIRKLTTLKVGRSLFIQAQLVCSWVGRKTLNGRATLPVIFLVFLSPHFLGQPDGCVKRCRSLSIGQKFSRRTRFRSLFYHLSGIFFKIPKYFKSQNKDFEKYPVKGSIV